jgi:hypothetical protein
MIDSSVVFPRQSSTIVFDSARSCNQLPGHAVPGYEIFLLVFLVKSQVEWNLSNVGFFFIDSNNSEYLTVSL